MEGWLADSRPYEGQWQKWSWLSVLADFRASVSQVGPRLHAVLGAELAATVAASASLKADFEFLSHAAMAVQLQVHRATAPGIFGQLSSQWAAADARTAAWLDLVDACRDTSIAYETLATRRDLFWQLVRASDHDDSQMSDFLAGALGNNAFHIALARIWLGDVSATEVSLPHPDQSAGLTEAEQLDFCERLLTKPPTPGRYVVWIAFGRASPGVIHRVVGPISFWNAKWLRTALEQGGPDLASIPAEVKVTGGTFRPEDLPDDEDVLLVRVDLDAGAWTDPVRVATEQVEAVVTLAGFHVDDAKWRPLAGHLVTVDDGVKGFAPFHQILSPDEIVNQLYQHAMDAELADLALQLGAHLPIVDGALSEIVQAVRWWQQARRQPPLAAVLMHVRVLELLTQRARVNKKWYEYLDDYQRSWWVRYVMVDELGQVINGCLLNYERIPSTADQQWLRDLSQAVTTYLPGGAFRRDLGKGVDALPELARLFSSHDDLGRRVQDAVGRYTVSALPAWRDDLEREWHLTLDRLVRVRNALAHGGPIVDDTVATVHGFAEQLAGWSLALALEGLLKGQDVAASNAAHQHDFNKWNDGLSSAGSVTEALIRS